MESERRVEPALIELAYAQGLPLVAANEAYFAAAADYEAQDALLCVAEGALISAADRRRLSPEHRFKTRAEMRALFADLEEAADNSVEIALRCAYRPLTRKPILPHFTAADGARGRRGERAAPPGRRRARASSARATAARPATSKTTTASGSNSSSGSSRG